MYKTRSQTTEKRIGDYKNKTFYGPPELVPVHPLGDAVYEGMDDNTIYTIKQSKCISLRPSLIRVAAQFSSK
jgi:hypothetical protein